MKDKEKKILFCPNCGKPIEAFQYYNVHGYAMSDGLAQDPVASRIICDRCNYGGFPLQLTLEEYKKIDFSKWKMLDAPFQLNTKYMFWLKFLASLIVAQLFVFLAGPEPICLIAGLAILIAILYLLWKKELIALFKK
ncbi:MAG: hypothetical protein V1492_04970 [Candidatus Micrarchaeota archaeon]